MTSKYTLFIIHHSNKEFYYKALNDSTLALELSFFNDRYSSKIKKDGSTYILEWVEIDYYDYSLVIEYRNLNKKNRDYIAVGALISKQITVNESIVFYQMIAEVHANLLAHRDKNGIFSSSFNINNYSYEPKSLTLDSAYLVDALCKVSLHDNAVFQKGSHLVYNDVEYQNKIISSKDFFFIGNNGLNEIEELTKINKNINNKLKVLKQENQSQKELIDSIENIATNSTSKNSDTQEKTFREKYFWFIIIISLILGFLISLFLNDNKFKEQISSKSTTITQKKEIILFPRANLDSKSYENTLFKEHTNSSYIYGRVLELVNKGNLDNSIAINMEKIFKGENGKFASKWGKILNLNSLGQIPKIANREQGLLAIWECNINNSGRGHIGFVEEILEDGKKYRLSDFNRLGDGDNEFRDEVYAFPNNELDKNIGNGYLGTGENGCFPIFYKL